MNKLFAELKRRNVFRVGLAYAFVGWLLMQVADALFPALLLPEWSTRLLVAFLIIGFPVALLFAWAFEMTPEGVKREAEVDRAASITTATGRNLDFVIIGALTLALGYFIWERQSGPEREVDSAAVEKSIAVLPFDNISNEAANEPFTVGIHDDLLTQLSKIGAIKVISRTSVLKYRDTTKSIPEIAQELGVATVLEGGVQRAGNAVRINVQLIDAATDRHLWAETYNRELTARNIFAIQSEIAASIASALHAALTPGEQGRIDAIPTENLEAYDAYLLGRQRAEKRSIEALNEASAYFQKAIDLDQGYALAYVGLADAKLLLLTHGGLSLADALAVAEPAVEKALELDPGLGPAYTTVAAIREMTGDFAAAERAFRRAIELSPNYARGHQWYGEFLRESLGRPAEAVPLFETALALDPMSPILHAAMAWNLVALGQLQGARRGFLKSIEIDPGFVIGHVELGRLDSNRGDAVAAAANFRKVSALDPGGGRALGYRVVFHLDLGDATTAGSLIDKTVSLAGDNYGTLSARAVLKAYEGDLEAARPLAARAAAINPDLAGWSLVFDILFAADMRAARHRQARERLDMVYPGFDAANPPIRANGWRPAVEYAAILLATDEAEQARTLIGRALAATAGRPRLGAWGYNISDAQLLALAGRKEEALAALRAAVDDGWRLAWWWHARYDPTLDAIRGEPEFAAIFAAVEADMARRGELVARDRDGDE